MNIDVLIVQGLVASGKTTLIQFLVANLRENIRVVVREDVDMDDVVDILYSEQCTDLLILSTQEPVSTQVKQYMRDNNRAYQVVHTDKQDRYL